MVEKHWLVKLPSDVHEPFEVYVNGIQQRAEQDFHIEGNALYFKRELVSGGKLSGWRWLMGAFGIGTYRRNDEIDVRYQVNGEARIASGLKIQEPSGGVDCAELTVDS